LDIFQILLWIRKREQKTSFRTAELIKENKTLVSQAKSLKEENETLTKK